MEGRKSNGDAEAEKGNQSPVKPKKKFNIQVTKNMQDLIDESEGKSPAPKKEIKHEEIPREQIHDKLMSRKPVQLVNPQMQFHQGSIASPNKSSAAEKLNKHKAAMEEAVKEKEAAAAAKPSRTATLFSYLKSMQQGKLKPLDLSSDSGYLDRGTSQRSLDSYDSHEMDGSSPIPKTPNSNATKSPGGTGGRRRRSVIDHNNKKKKEDENLGEDFESTPWLPPSIEKAEKYRHDNIFRGGDTRIDSVDMVNADDISLGVSLYFQFAMNMALCFFFMTLLSLPALIFCYHGYGIALDDQDNFGFYHYTLGNIGFDKSFPNYQTASRCQTPKYQNAATNTSSFQCIHFSGFELSFSDAAAVLTTFEILQITVFLLGVIRLWVSVLKKTTNSSTEISVSNYAVMVTKLPPETSEKDLIDHFSDLYRLDQRDWKGRPVVLDAKPVEEVGNTGMFLYRGTWIAECVIHKAIGAFISSFKSKQHLMESMFRYRALLKMYNSWTPHAHGPNLKKYDTAEQQMLRIGLEIDHLTEENIIKSGLKLLIEPEEVTEEQQNQGAATDFLENLEKGWTIEDPSVKKEENSMKIARSNKKKKKIDHRVNNRNSIYYHVGADTCAAFIIFQHAESCARCIEDYLPYSNFPFNYFFYPDKLKLRNAEIVVTQAPEPDQVLWENLEVPLTTKFYLRLRTAGVTFLLIIFCFIIILQASIYKEMFNANKPDLSLCASYLPELYLNETSVDYGRISLILPPDTKEREHLNKLCQNIVSDSFFGIYVYDQNFSNPIANYNFESCLSHSLNSSSTSHGGLCPVLGAEEFCPCITTTSQENCKTAGCSDPTLLEKCEVFHANVLGACYCTEQVTQFLKSGVATGLGISQCQTFFYQYSLASSLTYASVLATTAVNTFTRYSLKLLAKYEAYSSLDEYQASMMSKIFLSNYATMAVLVLFAYGNGGSKNGFLQSFHIFTGPYPDFTPAWYGNVGFYLTTTFILQSFSPLIANLVKYSLVKPILRLYHFPRVKARTSHSIVMQDDLNKLMVGEIFDSTDHAAQLLTLLFFAMTYGAGLPLLMPLSCFAFILYFRIDKFLICRYYRKPLNIGPAVIKEVLFYLPFAAMIRLGFAIWMYSNNDVLPVHHGNTEDGSYTITSSSNSKSYQNYLHQQKANWGGSSPVNDRLFQFNTFPLFAYFFFVIIATFIKIFWKQLPFYWIWKIIEKYVFQWFWKSKKKNIYATDEDDLKRIREQHQQDKYDREQKRKKEEAEALSGKKSNPSPTSESSKRRRINRRTGASLDDDDDGGGDLEANNNSSPSARKKRSKKEPELTQEEKFQLELDQQLTRSKKALKRKRGTITVWELKKSGDPLRQCSAPFTEDYFRLIKHVDYIPETCYEMWIYDFLDNLTEIEIEEGFKVSQIEDFIVHIKVWKHENQKKIDGNRSAYDTKKKTYEVIADHRLYSFDIEKISEYTLAMQGLREGISSVIDFIRTNHQDKLLEKESQNGIAITKDLFVNAGLSSHFFDGYAKKHHITIKVTWKDQLYNTIMSNLYKAIGMSYIESVPDEEDNKLLEEGATPKAIAANKVVPVNNKNTGFTDEQMALLKEIEGQPGDNDDLSDSDESELTDEEREKIESNELEREQMNLSTEGLPTKRSTTPATSKSNERPPMNQDYDFVTTFPEIDGVTENNPMKKGGEEQEEPTFVRPITPVKNENSSKGTAPDKKHLPSLLNPNDMESQLSTSSPKKSTKTIQFKDELPLSSEENNLHPSASDGGKSPKKLAKKKDKHETNENETTRSGNQQGSINHETNAVNNQHKKKRRKDRSTFPVEDPSSFSSSVGNGTGTSTGGVQNENGQSAPTNTTTTPSTEIKKLKPKYHPRGRLRGDPPPQPQQRQQTRQQQQQQQHQSNYLPDQSQFSTMDYTQPVYFEPTVDWGYYDHSYHSDSGVDYYSSYPSSPDPYNQHHHPYSAAVPFENSFSLLQIIFVLRVSLHS